MLAFVYEVEHLAEELCDLAKHGVGIRPEFELVRSPELIHICDALGGV